MASLLVFQHTQKVYVIKNSHLQLGLDCIKLIFYIIKYFYMELAKMKLLLSFFFFFIFFNILYSQNNPIRISGSSTLTQEFYSINGIKSRRPANVSRAIIRMNLSVYNKVQIPFELYLSTEKTRFTNPFNQFGLSPKVAEWLTLHAGYFSTRISNLTFGDLRLYGGGFELTPGNFQIKFMYGRSRKGIKADTTKGFAGLFSQMLYAASIGYSFGKNSFLNLNIMHAADDSTSLVYDSRLISPTENLTTSLNFGIKFSKAFRIEGEAAIGLFTNNTKADTLNTNLNVPSFLFTPNYSSQIDGAALLSIYITPSRNWGFSLNSKWIGPGYITQGFAQLQNDLLEINLAPTAHLLKRKLNLKGTLGYRLNNLRKNHITTTKRLTGSMNMNYRITNNLSLDFLYNYNKIKSYKTIDSIKISNIFGLISITPGYLFDAFSGKNNIMLNFTHQNAVDQNPFTKSSVAYSTTNINYIHSIFFPSSLNITLNILSSSTDLTYRSIDITTINANIGYQFFNHKLSAVFGLGFNSVTTTKTDHQALFQIYLSYGLNKYGTLAFNLTNNNYKASEPYSPSYNELHGAFQYSISF